MLFRNNISSDTADPSQHVARGELRVRLALAVKKLPVEQREVFLMRVHANLPFKEIARIQKNFY